MPTRTVNGHTENWKASGKNFINLIRCFFSVNINFIIKSYSYFLGKLKVFCLWCFFFGEKKKISAACFLCDNIN
jgi:hypothetical protein